MTKAEFNERYGPLCVTEYDEQWYWDCVRGSARLRDRTMDAYAKRGRELGLDAATAGLYLMECQAGAEGVERARTAMLGLSAK